MGEVLLKKVLLLGTFTPMFNFSTHPLLRGLQPPFSPSFRRLLLPTHRPLLSPSHRRCHTSLWPTEEPPEPGPTPRLAAPPGSESGAPSNTPNCHCTWHLDKRKCGGFCGRGRCPGGSTPAPHGLTGLRSDDNGDTDGRCSAASPADPRLCWSEKRTGTSSHREPHHTHRSELPRDRKSVV